MEVYQWTAKQEPVTISYTTPHVDIGWMRLMQVNHAWRQAGLEARSLWADNVCAFASVEAVEEFAQRARRAPLTIDIDHLLKACYVKNDTRSLALIMENHGAFLKSAKTIVSSLLRDDPHIAPFNVLHHVSPARWSSAFHFGVYQHLKKLTYHVSTNEDVPSILDSKLTYLEVLTVRNHEVHVEADNGFETQYKSTSTWRQGPVFDAQRLLDCLGMHTRLEVLVIDALRLTGLENIESNGITLNCLRLAELRGPNLTDISRFASHLSSDPRCRYRIASNVDGVVVPAQALTLAGINNTEHVLAVFEVSRLVQWTTLCPANSDNVPRPRFCDGFQDLSNTGDGGHISFTPSACVDAEINGSANFLLRHHAVSRKAAGNERSQVDAYLGVNTHAITHLVVRELTRQYNGVSVWQMQTVHIDFVKGLNDLTAVEIEDERLAVVLTSYINSPHLKDITIVFRQEWLGKTDHTLLRRGIGKAAGQSRERLKITLKGVRREHDEKAVRMLSEEDNWDVLDERDARSCKAGQRNLRGFELDLQVNQDKLASAKVNIAIQLLHRTSGLTTRSST
ncbi:unnamed protein product [Peniophora sp. CBMAI 1063]|nr:unnamed protein product [Peniophora sp. CBMAI 1063]